ncbi:nuclear transport factor 2 family protein [Undibacter mobilis]|uniref:Nuclear transport factor 2 family protein n=1 Tax=Undibacter mobilis TaxID=2292256 RepID=A0A371B2H4_9BRAD|nr:nuclear transport factor 2 family protein [Undibacter mobilis]RDV01789.1 nuclear transport factor 2 family protein [Undibacter mobilis]
MTTEITRAALEDIIDAFQRGDHTRLAARYDDDIESLLYAPPTVFPFAGLKRGKSAVLTGLLLVYRSYIITRYAVSLALVDGDRAASIADFHLVQRSTGRVITTSLASFYRFRDGKLIGYRGFTDSFDWAEQVLGRELDP